jgi:hypothetical protein
MRVKSLLVAAVFAATGVSGAQAEPVKIRLSYIAPVSNWATMLFQKPELARHLGKSYTSKRFISKERRSSSRRSTSERSRSPISGSRPSRSPSPMPA